MTARGDDGIVEEILADLATERGFERRDEGKWRVEPVRGIRDMEQVVVAHDDASPNDERMA